LRNRSQHGGGEDAGQNRLVSLALVQTGGRQSNDHRVVAGKHQIDHHDLEKRCQGFRGKHLGHAGHSVKRPIRHHSSLELPEGPGLGRACSKTTQFKAAED
jgi:hypothetical protein